MKNIFKKPYLYYLIIIFLAYLAIDIIINEFYVTIKYVPYYIDTINWVLFVTESLLAVTIAALVSINSVLTFIRYKERKSIRKEGAISCAAAIGGLTTGVCPICATVLPLLFSLFGISFSWGFLPFQGIEIQVLVVVILLANLYFLKKGLNG